MDCQGCVLKLKSFLRLCDDQERLFEFLKSHNLIKKSVTCLSCGKPATFDNRKLKWRCQKARKVKKGHKIQIVYIYHVRSVQRFGKARGLKIVIIPSKQLVCLLDTS